MAGGSRGGVGGWREKVGGDGTPVLEATMEAATLGVWRGHTSDVTSLSIL